MTIAARLVLTAAALAMPTAAIAQQDRCIPQEDSRAVVANLLPSLLRSAAESCAPQLARGAYLPRHHEALADGLEPLAQQSWPQARIALEAVFQTELPDNPVVIEFARTALTDGIAAELDAKSCDAVDRLVAELEPLPPRNFANVFALFLEMGMNENEDSDLRICRS